MTRTVSDPPMSATLSCTDASAEPALTPFPRGPRPVSVSDPGSGPSGRIVAAVPLQGRPRSQRARAILSRASAMRAASVSRLLVSSAVRGRRRARRCTSPSYRNDDEPLPRPAKSASRCRCSRPLLQVPMSTSSAMSSARLHVTFEHPIFRATSAALRYHVPRRSCTPRPAPFRSDESEPRRNRIDVQRVETLERRMARSDLRSERIHMCSKSARSRRPTAFTLRPNWCTVFQERPTAAGARGR